MTTLRISAWKIGLQKISLTKLLQRELQLGIAAAKHTVDEVLEGRIVEVGVPDGTDAAALTEAIRTLGAECNLVIESPDQ